MSCAEDGRDGHLPRFGVRLESRLDPVGGVDIEVLDPGKGEPGVRLGVLDPRAQPAVAVDDVKLRCGRP